MDQMNEQNSAQMQFMMMSQDLRNVQMQLQQLQHVWSRYQMEVTKQSSQLKVEEENEMQKLNEIKKRLDEERSKVYDKKKEMVILSAKNNFSTLTSEIFNQKINSVVDHSQKSYNDKRSKEYVSMQQTKQRAHQDLLNMKTIIPVYEQELVAFKFEFENSSLRASVNPEAKNQLQRNQVNYAELMTRLNQFINQSNKQIDKILTETSTSPDILFCTKWIRAHLQALSQNKEALGDDLKAAKVIEQVDCESCWDPYDPDELYFSPCGHFTYCRTCMHDFLKAKITDVNIFTLSCPVNKQCNEKLPADISRLYLEGEEAEKFDKMLIQDLMKDNQCFCPRCGEQYEKPPPGNPNVVCVNQKCTLSFCVDCKSTWHVDETCEEYQKRPEEERSAEARSFLEFAQKEGWKRCPACAMVINKHAGCQYVVCGMCKNPICWETGKLRKDCGGGHNCH